MSEEIRTVEVVTREERHGCLIQVLRVEYAGDPPNYPPDHQVDIFGPDDTVLFSREYEMDSWEFALNEAYEWLRWNSPHKYRYADQPRPQAERPGKPGRVYQLTERGRALAHLLKTGSAAV